MQYQDCSIEAITGKYDRNFHNVSNHVHPVIAALFLPKIDQLETHFIHSNISNIVKTRYNKEAFTSMSDALLYDSLIKDPNDVVCDSRSTLTDLYTRAQLQNQLWNCVLSLRNGQYYNTSFREFINSVDMCKMNKYDSPDLVYGRYDGTILKRLFSAFSFRPTVVTSTPVYNSVNINPYATNIKPTVTYVPMINLKLPFSVNDNSPVDLNSALEQQQLLLENGVVIPKFTSLIYSRGVLIFYVDRRTNVIYNSQANLSFAFNKLPTAVAGFDRLNEREINFETTFKIRNDEYNLRSVVISEVNKNASVDSNIVIGSSTAIMVHPDINQQKFSSEYLLYDPYCVVNSEYINKQVVTKNPIEWLEDLSNDSNKGGFFELARKRGIIFVYQLTKDSSAGTILY